MTTRRIRPGLPMLALAFLALLALGAAPRAACAQGQLGLDPTFTVDEVPESGSLRTARNVSGLLGATIQCGRFTVLIPPGAIAGSATVTVSVPDRSKLLCDLSISPASANHFLVPVTLIANGAGGTLTAPALLRLYWFDPSDRTWKPVGAAASSGLVMIGTLKHFSTYAGGRAGW